MIRQIITLVVAMLLDECAQGGVDVRVGHSVTDISRADSFRLESSRGSFTAPALVLADMPAKALRPVVVEARDDVWLMPETRLP